eukprot:9205380-Ditylum_brightwellii.AAC.1
MGPAWLHMHTVQRNDTSKGIPTKIMCGAGRSLAGAPPCNFVEEGCGSGAHYWAKMQHVSFYIPKP